MIQIFRQRQRRDIVAQKRPRRADGKGQSHQVLIVPLLHGRGHFLPEGQRQQQAQIERQIPEPVRHLAPPDLAKQRAEVHRPGPQAVIHPCVPQEIQIGSQHQRQHRPQDATAHFGIAVPLAQQTRAGDHDKKGHGGLADIVPENAPVPLAVNRGQRLEHIAVGMIDDDQKGRQNPQEIQKRRAGFCLVRRIDGSHSAGSFSSAL